MLVERLNKIQEKEKEKQNEANSINELASLLLLSIDIAHKLHWKTSSFAQHNALDEYYKEFPELVDELIEAYQGCYLKLISSELVEINTDNGLELMNVVINKIKEYKEKEQDSAIINILEECLGFVYKIRYKLNFLS